MSSHWEDRRKSLGMSRKDAADGAAVTQGAVWSIENMKVPRGGAAVLKKYGDWLASVEEATDEEGRAKAKAGGGADILPTDERDGFVVEKEYGRLKVGDRFRVKDEEGVFRFRGHVRCEETGSEWVDGIGGQKGYPSAFRSFRLDRVIA